MYTLKSTEIISIQIYEFLQIEHICVTSTQIKNNENNKTKHLTIKKIQNVTSFPEDSLCHLLVTNFCQR